MWRQPKPLKVPQKKPPRLQRRRVLLYLSFSGLLNQPTPCPIPEGKGILRSEFPLLSGKVSYLRMVAEKEIRTEHARGLLRLLPLFFSLSAAAAAAKERRGGMWRNPPCHFSSHARVCSGRRRRGGEGMAMACV